MELVDLRNELSVRGKNGINFLLSGIFVWTIITIIFLQPLEIHQKNIFLLCATGLMFPLSIGIAAIIKADWKLDNNPLGKLGLYLNFAQFIYFPIVFWGLINIPEDTVLYFAIITGAHFFPYGWFYNTKAYYVMAPVISVTIFFLRLYLKGENLWLIPLAVVCLLLLLIFWLFLDFKKKTKYGS